MALTVSDILARNLLPGMHLVSGGVAWVRAGNELEDTRRAMMRFRMKLPLCAPPLSIVRKKRENG